MVIKNAQFVISNTDVAKCPAPTLPEFAFIGRSNVGKSSLINMLVNQKSLAKTSQKPGKTRLINHFQINQEKDKPNTGWFLTDLPGYGYASVSKSDRDSFQKIIDSYILKRENLQCLFVLIDSRIPPQKIDLDFLNWLGGKGIPFILVFTKVDKQSSNKTASNIAKFRKQMLKTWEAIPQQVATSSVEKTGKDEILTLIGEIIEDQASEIAED
ncbi:MAG: GTP-binding protein [Sphingobacteriales bacterium]|jgi:GTP-binding protein